MTKRVVHIALISVLLLIGGSLPVLAQDQSSEFVPLQEIEGFIEPGQEKSVPTFLNNAFRIGVGVAAMLAVIFIIIGGFEYMTSDIPGMKQDAKGRITAALLGLAIILLSWLILSVINPNILDFRIFENSARSGGGSATVAEAQYCNHTFVQGAAAGTENYGSAAECQARCRAEHPDGVCVTLENI